MMSIKDQWPQWPALLTAEAQSLSAVEVLAAFF